MKAVYTCKIFFLSRAIINIILTYYVHLSKNDHTSEPLQKFCVHAIPSTP